MRARFVALTACAIVVIAGPARADDPPALPTPRLVPDLSLRARDKAQDAPQAADSWSARPRSLNLQGGSLGGPLGYGGLSFEYAPIPWVVGGIGAGFTGSGPTAAFMPRLRLPITRWFAVGMGVPLSAGPYEYVAQAPTTCLLAGCPQGFRTTRTWDLAFWVHIEPNVEFRLRNGIALRVYAGQSDVLNPRGDRCASTLQGGCPSRLGEQQYYGGLALGYAF